MPTLLAPDFAKKAARNRSLDGELFGLLDAICQQFEITESMFEEAKGRYESIAKYLQEPVSPLAQYDPEIYPQGSVNLGTTVRPINENEYDVDVICQLEVPDRTTHAEFIALLYDRLEQRGCYTLKKMNRCVRVEYANQFHIDITPAIPDDSQGPENILVTDKASKRWKESNPRDYATWFKAIAARRPSINYANRELMAKEAAEPLPEPTSSRPLLTRIVQLLKRHRDVMFDGRKEMPISAIITTLAAQSYEANVGNAFDSQVEFVLTVIDDMPGYLEVDAAVPAVPNPENPKENFADKWITHPEREEAFHEWHEKAAAHYRRLFDTPGDKTKVAKELSAAYGESQVKQAMVKVAEQRKIAEDARQIGVNKVTGLIAPAAAGIYQTTSKTMPVPTHTNFGK